MSITFDNVIGKNTMSISNASGVVRMCNHRQPGYQFESFDIRNMTITLTQKPMAAFTVDGLIDIESHISTEENGDLDLGVSFVNALNQDKVSQKIRSVKKGKEVDISLLTTDFNVIRITGKVLKHFVGSNA
jgi:hypothetical protein